MPPKTVGGHIIIPYRNNSMNIFVQRHIPDAGGRVDSVDNGIFIHAIVPRHVETVCCLYHQKKDFISVPYEPRNAEYLKKN